MTGETASGGDLLSNLSRRETQCVELAAQKLTDREIATRLGIGVRTVGNYLSSAYGKLGVRCRLDLASVLRESR